MFRRKFLIVSESINVEDSSASKVNVALIKNLQKLNYKIKVLHYSRKDIFLDNIECISISEYKWSYNYFLSRIQRLFQRWTGINFSRQLENLFGHSFTFFNDSGSISKAIKMQYDGEDLIITLSKGASFRPHHAMLCLSELHSKWLAYVHDPYPFHFYPKPYKWLEAGGKFKENFFRKVSESAKYSAFPSHMLLNWMSDFYPNFRNTGFIIPHQYDHNDKLFDNGMDSFIKKGKINLIHSGSLMNTRPIIGLLNALEKLNVVAPEVGLSFHILFIGNIDYFKHELLSFQKRFPDNISFTGQIDYSYSRVLESKGDISIIIESDSYISPFLPGKFPNCIGLNKKILLLSPYFSETKNLLGEKYWSEVGDKERIFSILKLIYDDWYRGDLCLNRPDLMSYVGKEFLEKQLIKNVN